MATKLYTKHECKMKSVKSIKGIEIVTEFKHCETIVAAKIEITLEQARGFKRLANRIEAGEAGAPLIASAMLRNIALAIIERLNPVASDEELATMYLPNTKDEEEGLANP